MTNENLHMTSRKKNIIFHQFNRLVGMASKKSMVGKKYMADKKWLYAFLKRNPLISLRAPEPTCLVRAMGFDKPAVSKFFKLQEKVVDTQHI